MRVLVIQNCETEDIGLYAVYMQQHGIEFDVVHAYLPDSVLRTAGDYDALFIGGTPVSIWEIDQHAFLLRESAYLSAALDKGKPCFGICGGGQLVTHLLGAEVRKNPEMEIGCHEVRLTARGESDPLLRGFPPRFPVFQWHADTFDIPQGASLLAEGNLCKNQLFRRGTVVGVQFHVEVTADTVALWADEYADELKLVKKDSRTIVEECRNHESQMCRLCNLLLDNFFALVS